jgi:hypothetical protein
LGESGEDYNLVQAAVLEATDFLPDEIGLEERLRRLDDPVEDHYSSCYSRQSSLDNDPEWEDDSANEDNEDYLLADLNLDKEERRLDRAIPMRVKKLGKRGGTKRVKGGPEQPCYDGMSAVERKVTKEDYTKKGRGTSMRVGT